MARVRLPSGTAAIVPGLLAAAAFVAMAASEGGYPATTWYPGALFLLGLLVATALGLRPLLAELPRPTRLALALLTAYVLWSFASIGWAEVRGDAWDGANRGLLYLIVFAIFTIPDWRPRTAAIVAGAYSVAIAAVAAVVLLQTAGSADPALDLIQGRFVPPTGYQNATAALLLGAFWIALLLASRRETPWPLRGLFLASGGLLLEVAILPQSRGASIVFPIALVAYLILVPGRMRTLIALAPIIAAALLAAPPLLDVYEVATASGDLTGAFDQAANAVLLSCIGLLLAGTLIGLVDSRLNVSERATRRSEKAAIAAILAVGAALSVVALQETGQPIEWAEDRWENFKSGYTDEQFDSSRFAGDLGNNRYDFWRVSLDKSFSDSIVTGAGADNFPADYLRERRSPEEPRFPHSLPIQILAQTGLIGSLVFVGFLLAAGTGAVRATRRLAPQGFARALAGALGVGFFYWFGHGAADWFWAFPAVTAAAFAWLAIAGRMLHHEGPAEEDASGRLESTRPGPSGPRGARLVVSLAGAALVAAAAASFLLPFASARDLQRAAEISAADPDGAYSRLDRARSLNFLSARPDLLAGSIASRMGDMELASEYFSAALERDPTSWYALLSRGAISSEAGDRGSALDDLRAAGRLNPSDGLIAESLDRVRRGGALSLGDVQRDLLDRICSRIGRTETTSYCPR